MQKTNNDEVVKSRKSLIIVIPAPYQVRGKLQPESSSFEGLEILWTPVFTGETTFYESINNGDGNDGYQVPDPFTWPFRINSGSFRRFLTCLPGSTRRVRCSHH